MADRKSISQKRGQAARLSAQHLQAGGVSGIFGSEAQTHETSVKEVAERILLLLRQEFPKLSFRFRGSIRKQEIHDKLNLVDLRLGVKLFCPTAGIKPDGGITEVLDKNGAWRVILVGEAKHQGNDVQNIARGYRTPKMERKGQHIMPAGNAIERVHKNIQEMKNFMLNERHFPYVVFLQGSIFATDPLLVKWPDGTEIPILPSDSSVNRIDRVTAANYGMEINRDCCRNIIVNQLPQQFMLQVTSIYAQCELFKFGQMIEILWGVALTSLEVLADDLPTAE